MTKKKRSIQNQATGSANKSITGPTAAQHRNSAVSRPPVAASQEITYPMNSQNIVAAGPVELVQAKAHQTASFFPSSSGFNVSGGQFSSYRDQHTLASGNVIINVNPAGPALNVETGIPQQIQRDNHHRNSSSIAFDPSQIFSGSDRPEALEASPATSTEQNTLPSVIHQVKEQVTQGQTFRGDMSAYSGHLHPARPSALPVRKSSDIYYRHLSILGRGSPLWIPEPSNTLPIECQRAGIGIGDVGILMDSGGFDFLFNIYQPQNDTEHPINPRTMPEGFYPLEPPEERDVSSHVEFKNNSFLASSHVNSRHDGDSAGLIFESSASDGAILTMPNGANSKDLENTTIFQRYVRLNAQRWYTYANEVRGRNARNGDIRLVSGKTSATTWGMATFANRSEQSAFRLKFKPTTTRDGGGNGLGPSYGWKLEYSGVAEVKSGPDAHEIEKLRNHDQEEDHPMEYSNQCLFIRTTNVTLQDNVWKKLTEKWAMLDLDENDTPTSNLDSSSIFLSGSSKTSNSTMLDEASGSGGGGASGTTDKLARNLDEVHYTNQFRHSNRSVHLSASPPPLSLHPSKVINKFLLAQKPEAKMAITEDNDWISVLQKSDRVFPEPDVLISRIITMYEICNEEGRILDAIHTPHVRKSKSHFTDVVFLQIRSPQLVKGGSNQTNLHSITSNTKDSRAALGGTSFPYSLPDNEVARIATLPLHKHSPPTRPAPTSPPSFRPLRPAVNSYYIPKGRIRPTVSGKPPPQPPPPQPRGFPAGQPYPATGDPNPPRNMWGTVGGFMMPTQQPSGFPPGQISGYYPPQGYADFVPNNGDFFHGPPTNYNQHYPTPPSSYRPQHTSGPDPYPPQGYAGFSLDNGDIFRSPPTDYNQHYPTPPSSYRPQHTDGPYPPTNYSHQYPTPPSNYRPQHTGSPYPPTDYSHQYPTPPSSYRPQNTGGPYPPTDYSHQYPTPPSSNPNSYNPNNPPPPGSSQWN